MPETQPPRRPQTAQTGMNSFVQAVPAISKPENEVGTEICIPGTWWQWARSTASNVKNMDYKVRVLKFDANAFTTQTQRGGKRKGREKKGKRRGRGRPSLREPWT